MSEVKENNHRPSGFLSLMPFHILLLLLLLGGSVTGLGLFTFTYAEGTSYFSDNPDSCVNCHVMRDVYEAWQHSSHKAVAACNDCHSPHTLPGKYIIKGINGWNHSVAFTTGNFPEPIQITNLNREVALENCLYCHSEFVDPIVDHEAEIEQLDCLRCHQSVGHPQ